MRLVLDSDPRINLVRRYGDGVIVIGEAALARPCIVMAQQLLPDWDASAIDQLTAAQIEPLLALKVNIVLLGAGETHTLAPAPVRAVFRTHGIALECMSLGAACRTYNILANEERSVAAGLFP